MTVDFDIDGDGKITEQEVAMKERMLEVELREEKAESQKKMAWIAMIMMIGFTVVLFTPLMSDTRVAALADLLGYFTLLKQVSQQLTWELRLIWQVSQWATR